MSVVSCEDKIVGINRAGETVSADFPALITVEKSLNLRLPSIRSKTAPRYCFRRVGLKCRFVPLWACRLAYKGDKDL